MFESRFSLHCGAMLLQALTLGVMSEVASKYLVCEQNLCTFFMRRGDQCLMVDC